MTKPEAKPTESEVSGEELEQQEGRPLPDREAMSLITPLPGYDQPVPLEDLTTPGETPEEAPDDRYEQ
jgi:hypothetical protein